MSIVSGAAKQASTRGFYPKTIEGSLRFNDDDTAYLSWTPDETGDSQKKFTLSFWFKRANIGPTESYLFSAGVNSADRVFLRLDSADNLDFLCTVSGSTVARYTTARVFRDVSAWYHIVVSVDTALANSDSIKVYVNGERDTTNPSTNFNNQSTVFGTQVIHTIGTSSWTLGSTNADGYFAEYHCVDNAQLGSDAFGELKNGVWVAKTPDVDYGTNGFYLDFQDDTEVEAFNTVLYPGSGNFQTVTGVGFKPDFVWIKSRNNTNANYLHNSVRGETLYLRSNSTLPEVDWSAGSNGMVQFLDDGFELSGGTGLDGGDRTYVAWCWEAGGAPTADNVAGVGNIPTAGSVKIDGVDSTSALAGSVAAKRISANTEKGFSIIQWDATTNATIATGLNQQAEMVIVREFASDTDWPVYHKDATTADDQTLYLNESDPITTVAATMWDVSEFSSSVIAIGTNGRVNGNCIAFCFHSVSGYSSFGSYTGNGSSTGPIIYTTDDGTAGGTNGFKPAWIMIKAISSGTTERWCIHDNTRTVTNGNSNVLFADDNLVENTTLTYDIDFLSNGFQIKTSHESHNQDTKEYIYAAFADTKEAAFWLDQSGNDNDWQPVNLDHNDTVADSPTDNFATLNPLDEQGTANTLSNGNLSISMAVATSLERTSATMGISSGQFYWEATVTSTTNSGGYFRVGFKTDDHHSQGVSTGGFWMVRGSDGETEYMINGSASQGSSSVRYGVGDVIMIAVDMDAGKWWVGANGFWVGDPSAGTGAIHDNLYGTVLPFVSNASSAGTHTADVNFGQQPFKYDLPE